MKMKQVNSFEILKNQIEKGGEISPFLFLSPNLEILHSELYSYISHLFSEYDIDMQSLFHISESAEALKIEEINEL